MLSPSERIRLSVDLRQRLRVLENFNYDPLTNGEKWVLDRLNEISPMKVIFDVGANQGEWSLMAHQVAPEATIHAFEVIPQTFQLLAKNVLSVPQIHSHPFGLSDKKGSLTFDYNEQYNTLSTAVNGSLMMCHGLQSVPISGDVKTGYEFCLNQEIATIDFLKIDTEGYEPQVLGGFLPLIESQNIKVIQFEYGQINIETHFLLKDFYQTLTPRGYIIGKIYPQDVFFKNYDHIDEDFIGPNYIAIKSSEELLVRAISG